MNWLLNLFKKKSQAISEIDRKWSVGFTAFETGKNLHFKKKSDLALPYFDKAIENNYLNAESFEYRANCLQEMEYFYDAIEDYNISIQKDPGKQNVYYMRSWAKASIKDYKGQVDDLNEAIRISKLNTEDSRYWNEYARETGYTSASAKYETDLVMAKMNSEDALKQQTRDIEFEEFYQAASPEDKIKLDKLKPSKTKVFKRRGE